MLLRQGMSGEAVSQLQVNLNILGEKLVVDGIYGRRTGDAIQRYQQRYGACVDGNCHGGLYQKIAEQALRVPGSVRKSTQAHAPMQGVSHHQVAEAARQVQPRTPPSKGRKKSN